MIICFVLTTKQLILHGYYWENLHADKLAGAKRVKESGKAHNYKNVKTLKLN